MDAHSTPDAPAAPAAGQKTGHPLAFWFFFWGEFAERCSFYGMRAILPLYLTAGLGLADTTAAPIYSSFKVACYLLPLLGGFLADRYFGRYWTIVGFSVPYVIGHFILGIHSTAALIVALALLAGGSGVIKPNISTLLGMTYDQQRPGQAQLRSSAFAWFYMAINLGALLSVFALPLVRNRYGYAIAFQFPAWLMVAALLVFALGKPHYAVEQVGPAGQPAPGEGEPSVGSTEGTRRALWPLFGAFALIVFFFVGYEHSDSVWVYFARDYVDLRVPFTQRTLAPDQVQFLNPLCVILFIPVLSWWTRRVDPDARVITPSRKIVAGFVCGIAAVAVMAGAGSLAGPGAKVSVVWLAGAYILLTLGEVLVYGTGLELAYAAAPAGMKGFVTACFLLTSTLGNLVNVWLTPLYGGSLTDAVERRGPLQPAPFFALTAAVMTAAALAFAFVGRRLLPPPASASTGR